MAIEVEIEFLSQPIDHLNIRFQVADLISSWTYAPSICFLLLSLSNIKSQIEGNSFIWISYVWVEHWYGSGHHFIFLSRRHAYCMTRARASERTATLRPREVGGIGFHVSYKHLTNQLFQSFFVDLLSCRVIGTLNMRCHRLMPFIERFILAPTTCLVVA